MFQLTGYGRDNDTRCIYASAGSMEALDGMFTHLKNRLEAGTLTCSRPGSIRLPICVLEITDTDMPDMIYAASYLLPYAPIRRRDLRQWEKSHGNGKRK